MASATRKHLSRALRDELHPTLNEGIDAKTIAVNSHKKLWWLCNLGHHWEAMVSNRTKGRGCPYCAGKKVWVGFNDLPTTHFMLSLQIHPQKNPAGIAQNISAGSSRTLWWLDEMGHEWEAVVSSRALGGRGCPFCSNARVLLGFNDLLTVKPIVAAEWHPTSNGGLGADQILAFSSRKVWWLCRVCSHSWRATIANRTKANRPTGCPACSGHAVVAGKNDLLSDNSEVSSELHPTKNCGLSADQIHAHSEKSFWWLCKACGYEWRAKVSNRNNAWSASGCGRCSGRRIIVGETDLSTVNPLAASQWHPTKNGELTPTEVSGQSNRSAWWLCEAGHEWRATIYSRMRAGCRKCSAGKHASKGEREVWELLKELGFDPEHSNRTAIVPLEIDLYIPELRIGIEYNGMYWHSEEVRHDPRAHEAKWAKAKAAGIRLIQIWELDWQESREEVREYLKETLVPFAPLQTAPLPIVVVEDHMRPHNVDYTAMGYIAEVVPPRSMKCKFRSNWHTVWDAGSTVWRKPVVTEALLS